MESGTEPGIDLETLDQRIQILESIKDGHIQTAVEMINSYQPDLLDDNRYLFFHLQQQHLIELIRNKNIDDALKFAQENLSDQGVENAAVLEELERSVVCWALLESFQTASSASCNFSSRTLALLAFEEPETSPFGDLLAPAHRQKVASELNTAFLGAESSDSSVSKLAYLLKFILWAQEELDKRKVRYPKMTDLTTACIDDSK